MTTQRPHPLVLAARLMAANHDEFARIVRALAAKQLTKREAQERILVLVSTTDQAALRKAVGD